MTAERLPRPLLMIHSDPAFSSIMGEQAKQALKDAIQGLPERKRECVLLYYGRDMNLLEVAETFNVTPSRISQILSEARTTLRRQLEGAGRGRRPRVPGGPVSRSIYPALSGAKVAWKQMEMVSNNLANATSDGFKQHRMSLTSKRVNENVLGNSYVAVAETVHDMSDGTLQSTGVDTHFWRFVVADSLWCRQRTAMSCSGLETSGWTVRVSW